MCLCVKFPFDFCSLAKPEHVEKLFNYVTKEPEASASENVKFRYAVEVVRVGLLGLVPIVQ